MTPEKIIENMLGNGASKLWKFLLNQQPKKSDVIVLLQGDRLDRVLTAVELYKKKFAEKILITGNNDLVGRGKRNDENDVPLEEIKVFFLKNGIPPEVIIIDEKALNTKDQAINTIATAIKNNWKTIIIVTSPYHLLRAYLAFSLQARHQGWPGEIIMGRADLGWSHIPSGRSKTSLEMLSIEMEKIKKYSADLLEIAE